MAKKRSARQAARKVKDKWRAKQWYTIRAPAIFNEAQIGETLADEPEKLEGRIAEATLQDVTGDFSKQHVKCYFRVRGTRGTDAVTTFDGHDLTSDYVRRLVRRSHSKVDGVYDITTSDGFQIRLKPMIVSERRTQAEQAHEMRDRARKVIEKRSKMTYNEVVKDIIEGNVAKEIYEQARLIVPLKRVEIRKSELLAEPGDAVEVLDVFAPPEEPEPEEDAEATPDDEAEEIEDAEIEDVEPEADTADEEADEAEQADVDEVEPEADTAEDETGEDVDEEGEEDETPEPSEAEDEPEAEAADDEDEDELAEDVTKALEE